MRSDEVGNKKITKARWAPDCGSVAVVAQNEIYLVSPEGKNLQLLDTFTKDIDAICWDRDGLHLYALVGDDLISLQPDSTSPGRTTLISGLGLNQPTSLSMHPTTKLLVTSDSSGADFMTIWLPDSVNGNPGPLTYGRVSSTADETHSPTFDKSGGTLFYRCREPMSSGLCSLRSAVTVDPVTRSFAFSGSESAILNSEGSGSGYAVSPDGLYIAGGLPGDRVAICPVTGTSLADTIDVTAVPPTTTRKMVDIDWGFY